MTEVPNFVPPEFVSEFYEQNRQEVLRVVDDERHNARKLWIDCYPEDMPEFVTDDHLEAWYKEDLVVRYIPDKEFSAGRMKTLPFRFDTLSLAKLDDLKSASYDPYRMEGGWYVMSAKSYTVEELDRMRNVPVTEFSIIPRAIDLMYGMMVFDRPHRQVDPFIRVPSAVELVYFANVDNPADSDWEEICMDPVYAEKSTKLLSVRFDDRQAQVLQRKRFDRFEGGVRPMWRLH